METTLPTNTATSEEIVQKTSNTSVCQFILEWEEERRVCYHTLEQALREFLQSEPTLSSGQEYMKICQQVKNTFDSLDKRLADWKENISDNDASFYYKWIEQLEQLERHKLETIVSVQKIRKDMKLFRDRMDTLELAQQQAELRRLYLVLSQVAEDMDDLLMEFRLE